jgi:beta-lactam-binding protein with PASTA domain
VNREFRAFARFPLYVLAFTMLGLLFGYLTFKVLSFSRTVEVPDLYGRSLPEAGKILTPKSLSLKLGGENYDALIPSGNIIRQDIPAGSKVKERRVIKVIVSKGPRVKSVPMLVNQTLGDAEALLLQKGLMIAKVIPVHSATIEKNRILSQKPGPDDQLSDAITVLVSLGPYEKNYYCPDFQGMSLKQAAELLKQMDLKGITEGAGQTVLSQKPEPGKQIKTGDIIYLQLF